MEDQKPAPHALEEQKPNLLAPDGQKPGLPTPENSKPTSPTINPEVKQLPEKRSPEKDAIAADLERYCVACLDAFNDHDFEYSGTPDRVEFLSRVSPTFQARIESQLDQSMTWPEMSQLWRAFAAAQPECRFKIVNISTDINQNGTATVWVEVDATGVLDVHWIRLLEMKWRIRRGRWVYYSLTTIAGNPMA